MLDCILTLIILKKQITNKDIVTEKDGMALYQSFYNKTIVKSILKSLTYFIYFRVLPKIYLSLITIPKKN